MATSSNNASSVSVKTEINKGREEIRVCYKINFEDKNWTGLKTVVLIQTIVKEKVRDKLTNQYRIKESLSSSYFISSQAESSDYYLDLKRKHWRIEAFHYIKDITYKEDTTKITKGNSPQNHSCLRSLAISLYKSLNLKNQAQAIRRYANNIPQLYQIIQGF